MPSKPESPVISNWHTLFEDFTTSTQEFYTAVEEAVRRRSLPQVEISRVLRAEGGIGSAAREYLRVRRGNIAFDICSAPYGQGHFFSWWLVRIPPQFGLFAVIGILFMTLVFSYIARFIFAPLLPDGLIVGPLVSMVFPFLLVPFVLLLMGYLVQESILGDEDWVMSLPILGPLYVFVFNPLTYYRLDTAMMFRDSVRTAVNEVIQEVREEKGLRLLGEDEFRPDVREERAAG